MSANDPKGDIGVRHPAAVSHSLVSVGRKLETSSQINADLEDLRLSGGELHISFPHGRSLLAREHKQSLSATRH